MNYAILILTLLGIFSDLIELTYDAGVLARRYLVPALVGAFVLAEMAWDKCTTHEFNIKFYRTPLTSGLALGQDKAQSNQGEPMNYKEQVKADRKAAAKQRQQDDYRQDDGYLALYDDTPMADEMGG